MIWLRVLEGNLASSGRFFRLRLITARELSKG
jgi:hypothetical protein